MKRKTLSIIGIIFTSMLSIAFAVTAFEDVRQSEGLLFTIAMQSIPVLGLMAFIYSLFKKN